MANEIYTRTNQKVFFAGLALDAWKQALTSTAFNAQAAQQAAREAALFHLYGGVLGLCQEVAGYYRTAAMPVTVEAFINRQALAAAPSQELGELLELREQTESWLARLLDAYHALFLPPQEKAAEAETSLIASVGQGGEALTAELLEAWRQQLKALILHFRQGLTEL